MSRTARSVVDSLREESARRSDALLRRRAPGAPGRSPGSSAPGACTSPRMVTTGGKSQGSAIVDWLNFTWVHDRPIGAVLQQLSDLMGCPVGGETAGGGLHGFEKGVRLRGYVNGHMLPFGWFCWGGESQRGRCFLSIDGGGCRAIRDWDTVSAWIGSLPGYRLTRVDLAVDLHDGEYTVDDAATWAAEGQFTYNGRPPSLDTQGDWLTRRDGRTLYVGKSANGKMLRVYEKGKQLGDLDSFWNRFEVQFGNRDRELPLEILTMRDTYFAGAYPALERVLAVVTTPIRTIRATTRATLDQALKHMKRSYGKWVDFFTRSGSTSADLVERVRVVAVPRRLNLASVADVGLAAAVLAAIQEVPS